MKKLHALTVAVLLVLLPAGVAFADCGFDCELRSSCPKCTPTTGRQQVWEVCFEEGHDGRITECFNGLIEEGTCGDCFAP
jgi:hypothetical protein